MPRVPRLRTITPAWVDSVMRYGPGGIAHASRAPTRAYIKVGSHRGVEHSSHLVFENPLKGIQPEDESVLSAYLYVHCSYTYMHAGATVYISTDPSSGLKAVVRLNSGLTTSVPVPLLWNNRVADDMRISITADNASSTEYCELDPHAWVEIRTLRMQTP